MKAKLLGGLLGVLILSMFIGGCGPKLKDGEQYKPGEKIVIKFSHVVAEDTPKGMAAIKFAELAAKRTGGRVEVQVFPNSDLYTDGEEMKALKDGSVQMIAPSTSKLGHLFPRWQVFDIPYMFNTPEEIHRVMEGKVGRMLYEDFAGEGIIPVAFWDNGFKQMLNSVRPLKTVEDFNGLTFRIMMNSRILEEQFKGLGAIPVPMRFDEVNTALVNKTIAGQENTMSNVWSKEFYKYQPYITISNHGFMGYAVLVKEDFWRGLPVDVRETLEDVIREVTVWEREQAGILNERDLNRVKNAPGVYIHILSLREREEWKNGMGDIRNHALQIIGYGILNELGY